MRSRCVFVGVGLLYSFEPGADEASPESVEISLEEPSGLHWSTECDQNSDKRCVEAVCVDYERGSIHSLVNCVMHYSAHLLWISQAALLVLRHKAPPSYPRLPYYDLRTRIYPCYTARARSQDIWVSISPQH